MGKYLRKSNSSSNGAVEVQKSGPGVRTRAKTLALQNQSPSSPPHLSASVAASNGSLGYLQLRSRRLPRLKPPLYKQPRRLNHINKCGEEGEERGNPNLGNSVGSSPNNSRIKGDSPQSGEKLVGQGWSSRDDNGEEFDGCCGENVLDSDCRERSTRESTPSNLILDRDAIHTPGSTTRPACSAEASRRLRSSTQRHLPTSRELEDFFADAEKQQQQEFIDKYNFDPVNDKPLPGRYEWEELKP